MAIFESLRSVQTEVAATGNEMRSVTGLVTALFVLAASGPACAWGWRGHEIVGSIAEQLLERKHPTAARNVRELLGKESLAVAAVWADCAKDVSRSSDGVFSYRAGPRSPKICAESFGASAEAAQLIDYVKRNWSQCDYSGGGKCHAAYHFDDVAIQRGAYGASQGAEPHDLVHAIDAAIAVLQGKPCPAPFDIRGKREALRLLAHFLGDLHQPLHVGSIYLDGEGRAVDPDGPSGFDPQTFTAGGNRLVFGAGGRRELHGDWDTVDETYGVIAAPSLVDEAAAVQPPRRMALSKRAAAWATEGIALAKQSFNELSFGPATKDTRADRWEVRFEDRDAYVKWRTARQREQLVKAGARLAEILATVCEAPKACEAS